jgi:hypothetical protein
MSIIIMNVLDEAEMNCERRKQDAMVCLAIGKLDRAINATVEALAWHRWAKEMRRSHAACALASC